MAKQSHDIGYQKQLRRQQSTDRDKPASTDSLARNLVKRGLSSKIILGSS